MQQQTGDHVTFIGDIMQHEAGDHVTLVPSEEEKLWGAIYILRKDFEALSTRVNQLEKAHNRLCHFVGHTTEGNTIDRDMGAKNEMGEGENHGSTWKNLERDHKSSTDSGQASEADTAANHR